MVMTTGTAIALALAAAAAGTEYVNTENTADRQDNAAAQAIQNQSKIQKQADTTVDAAVSKLAASNASDARTARLQDYLQVLRQNKGSTDAGLTPTVGSDAFRTDAASAANDTNAYAQKTAGLLSRIDAPQIQRQQEGFDYGNLATDLGLIGRESQGQNFLDQLRQSRIRRNAKLDLAAGLMSSGAGAAAGSGAASLASGLNSTYTNDAGYTYNLPSYGG